MATHQFYIYSSEFLDFNSDTGAFELDGDYTPQTGRLLVVVDDDDANADPSGDSNQTATVYDTDGNVVASGPLTVPAFAEVSGPDGPIFLDRFEINGIRVGYASSEELSPGASYPVTSTSSGAVPYTYFESNSISCFQSGCLIETETGPVPVETLRAGDRVLTKDDGLVAVMRHLKTPVTALRLILDHRLRPVVIPRDTFGPGRPATPLSLSRDHRILLDEPRISLFFGLPEVFAPAAALQTRSARPRIQQGFCYHHLLFETHQVIRANGLWVESFFPGGEAMRRLNPHDRAEVRRMLGGTADSMKTARPCLTLREARSMGYGTKPQAYRRRMRNIRVAGAVGIA